MGQAPFYYLKYFEINNDNKNSNRNDKKCICDNDKEGMCSIDKKHTCNHDNNDIYKSNNSFLNHYAYINPYQPSCTYLTH